MRQQGYIKRAPRIDLRRPAILINSDFFESHVEVLDVSSGGFRVEFDEPPRIGEFVTLRLEREEYPAQIRWVLGSEAGGVFLAALDAAEAE